MNTEETALAIVSEAQALVIADANDYIKAGALWGEIQDAIKAVHTEFSPNIQRWHEGHKKALADRDKFLTPLETMAKQLKIRMGEYAENERRKRDQEQRRLEAELHKIETDRKINDAISTGDESILDEPVSATVILPQTTPKTPVVFREVWDAEVTDLMALVRAVASGAAPLNLVVANHSALRLQAQSLKGTMNIPGVKAVSRRV